MKGEAVLVSIVAAVIVVLKERTEGFMSVPLPLLFTIVSKMMIQKVYLLVKLLPYT